MSELKMPSFGADMEEGTLCEWLVKPGDKVNRNDVVAVIETQKGVIDLELFTSGTVEALLVNEGECVAVGTPIALIDDGVESTTSSMETEIQNLPPSPAPVSTTTPATAHSVHRCTPASPLARRLAAEKGVDLKTIIGSGPEGAIIARDIQTARQKPHHAMDMQAMRQAIAAAMSRSKREIPHYYLETSVNLQHAVDWLTSYNKARKPEDQILLNALLHLAVAKALRKSPELNGLYQHEQFVPASNIHLGTAISIRGGGLISPAILNADQLTLDEMMQHLMDLSIRVREGGLRSSEMNEATITLSSMGDRGVEKVFGVIYPPQVALVGIGKPELKPCIVEGEVKSAMQVSITLAADHRASDGRQGAKFLNNLNKLLQKPERL